MDLDRWSREARAQHGSGKAKRTDTTVQTLAGKQRVNELAEMLAGNGATSTSRRQAKELIAAAA